MPKMMRSPTLRVEMVLKEWPPPYIESVTASTRVYRLDVAAYVAQRNGPPQTCLRPPRNGWQVRSYNVAAVVQINPFCRHAAAETPATAQLTQCRQAACQFDPYAATKMWVRRLRAQPPRVARTFVKRSLYTGSEDDMSSTMSSNRVVVTNPVCPAVRRYATMDEGNTRQCRYQHIRSLPARNVARCACTHAAAGILSWSSFS